MEYVDIKSGEDIGLEIRATFEVRDKGDVFITGYTAHRNGQLRFTGEPDVFAGALTAYVAGYADNAANAAQERDAKIAALLNELEKSRRKWGSCTTCPWREDKQNTEDKAAAAALRKIWQAGQNWFKKHEASE